MIDAMPRPRLPHLRHERTRHGKYAWYVRVGNGPRIRLQAPFGSPEFEAEYMAAMGGKPARASRKPSAGTLRWLWLRYRETQAWTRLGPASRRQRENVMRKVLEASGEMPLSEVSKAHIVAGRDSRAATPSMARHFVITMRGLFGWAAEADLMSETPTKDIKITKPKTEGFAVWTDEEVERFRAAYPLGTRERLAFDVLFYTGLRKSDAIKAGRQHVKGGVLTLRTAKTGETVSIRIMPELTQSIEAGPVGDLAFIVHSGNRPMTTGSFGIWFRRVCTAAGCPGTSHGLRKALATRLANMGASESELEALFGWRGGGMASLYTRKADRVRLAGTAMDRLK